jgi:hypothetical protein
MLMDKVMRYPKEERLVGRVYKDNLGAKYLVENRHFAARTKHIDVRAHFIQEVEEAGYLTVQHTRQELPRETTHKARGKNVEWES